MVLHSFLDPRVPGFGRQMTPTCREDDGCFAFPTPTSQGEVNGISSTWTPQESQLDPQGVDEIQGPLSTPVNGVLEPSNTQSVDPNLFQPDLTSITTTVTDNTGSTMTMKTTINVTVPPSSSATLITSTSMAPDPGPATVGTVEAAENGHNTNRLSAGEVTGVAMGTFILGAILAFIAAFFLFKQRNKHKSANVNRKDYPSYGGSAPDLAMMQSKSASSLVGRHSPYVQVSQIPLPAPLAAHPPSPIPATVFIPASASRDITAFLPPAADNEEVWNEVSHLFALMHEHVEKYYRDVNAIITPSMEPEIAEFGAKEVDMAELLQECTSSTAALKHALVTYVLGITEPRQKDDDEGTLFPKELYTAHAENHMNVVSGKLLTCVFHLRRIATNTTDRSGSRSSYLAASPHLCLSLQQHHWHAKSSQILDGSIERS